MKNNFIRNLFFAFLVAAIGYTVYELYYKNDKSEMTDMYAADRVEIKNVLETFLLNFSNGVYFTNNASLKDVPMYNFDATKFAYMGTMIQASQIISTFGDNQKSFKYSFVPENIEVDSCDGNYAHLSFTLYATMNSKTDTQFVALHAKKIGGGWKLDGNDFFTSQEYPK